LPQSGGNRQPIDDTSGLNEHSAEKVASGEFIVARSNAPGVPEAVAALHNIVATAGMALICVALSHHR